MEIDVNALERSLVPVLQDLFPALVNDITQDVRVVRGEQSQPRPQEHTYVNIKTISTSQPHREDVSLVDEVTDLSNVSAQWKVDIRVRGIGPDAQRVLTRIKFAFNRPDVREQICSLIPHGLSYSDCTEIIHIPALLETEWEPRSQMTLLFYTRVSGDVDLGVIEKVDSIEGTFQESITSPILTQTDPIDRNS